MKKDTIIYECPRCGRYFDSPSVCMDKDHGAFDEGGVEAIPVRADESHLSAPSKEPR